MHKLWCIVNLPNGTQQAVRWDPKSIGQECLEKVCRALGLTCEMEYFGLEYWTPNEMESRTHQWINLRNRLTCDNNSSLHGVHLMLALRVKFWVPVHFILQQSARELFYMQAKSDLLESRLNALDWKNAAKLAALLCQADGLRFNQQVLKHNCTEQCGWQQYQSQKQQQYQYQQQQQLQQQDSNNKENMVLNFKKPRLSQQKSLESIEHAFVCAKDQRYPCGALNNNCVAIFTSQISTSSDEEDVEVPNVCPLRIYKQYLVLPEHITADIPDDILLQIAEEHGKLNELGMQPLSAKYWLLQEIQDLPGYGEEVFSGILSQDNVTRCDIAVGAHGITVKKNENITSIPFSAITAAKSSRRSFMLDYVNDCNERSELEIKLPRHALAAGLYRSITERHAFYICDKVRGVVTNQFTRDLKGTIASMFNEDTELGKRYVFDIQHTSREVHDRARRTLHAQGVDLIAEQRFMQTMASSARCNEQLETVLHEKANRELSIELSVEARISEAMTCKICMDRAINTLFSPCCHVIACTECAERCTKCPNCRMTITSTMKIFLPPELRIQSNANPNNDNTQNIECCDKKDSRNLSNKLTTERNSLTMELST